MKMKANTIDIAMFLSLINEAIIPPKIGISQNSIITDFVNMSFLFINHAFEYLDILNSFNLSPQIT